MIVQFFQLNFSFFNFNFIRVDFIEMSIYFDDYDSFLKIVRLIVYFTIFTNVLKTLNKLGIILNPIEINLLLTGLGVGLIVVVVVVVRSSLFFTLTMCVLKPLVHEGN